MKYSKRLPHDLTQTDLYKAQQRLQNNVGLIDLTVSNPSQVGIIYPEEMYSTFSDKENYRYLPDPQGLYSARIAICKYYEDEHAIEISPDQVIITASTSEAYAQLFKILADPFSSILIPTPGYPLFDTLLRLESVNAVQYSFLYDGDIWWIDRIGIKKAVEQNDIRAIIIVNPNNPVGSYIHNDDLNFLENFCLENEIWLISDEVFSDYFWTNKTDEIFSTDFSRTVLKNKNISSVVLNGLSKILASPSLKLSWMVVSSFDRNLSNDILSKIEYVNDAYLSTSTVVQRSLECLFGYREFIQTQIRHRISENKSYVNSIKGRLESVGITPLHAIAGWYQVLKIPSTLDEESWVNLFMSSDNVIVQPGYFFDFSSETYIVISLISNTPSFKEGIDRIVRRVHAESNKQLCV